MSWFDGNELIRWIQHKDGLTKSQATKVYKRMRNEVKNGADPMDVLWEEGLEIIWRERVIEPDEVAEIFR